MDSNFNEWFNDNRDTVSAGILNQISKEDETFIKDEDIYKYIPRIEEMAEEYYWNYSY